MKKKNLLHRRGALFLALFLAFSLLCTPAVYADEAVSSDASVSITEADSESVSVDDSVSIAETDSEAVSDDASVSIAEADSEAVSDDASVSITEADSEAVSDDASVSIAETDSEAVSDDASGSITEADSVTEADSATEVDSTTEADSASEADNTEEPATESEVYSLSDEASFSSLSISDIPEYSDEPYAVINNNVPEFSSDELTTVSFESYSELDSLGRCGVAYACIGTDLMPTEDRGDISSVYPTGWVQAQYDSVDGGYLYNRCHLIGYQLTGENDNELNLITGTRYLNVEGMLPFENMVADYIEETGNHVLYRVTPYFEGNNLLASGVQIEAYSVEDDGEGICFNVYCYNVQPGIVIDYATGESYEDGTESDSDEVADISSCTITLSSTSYTYSGSAKKPTVTVKDSNGTVLKANTDYTVAYSNNVNAGTAKVTVTGTGNYTGTLSKNFTISAQTLKSSNISLSKTSYTYNGSARKPGVTVLNSSGSTLKKNTDYTVSYASGRKNVGTYKVKIIGTGNYKGTITKTFKITKAKLSSLTVSLSASSYAYTGKAKKPSVTVKSGSTTISTSNYTITYSSGRKAIGKYKVTIKGKNNCTGTVTKYFKIVPKTMTVKSLTSSAAKKLTVKWTKISGATKYQIRYRVKGTSSWTTKTVSSSKSSYTLTGLKAGKTYQVQIRAYKTVSGTKYYGSWSGTKSKTVKSSGSSSSSSSSSSTTVYITSTGTKYHKSGCRYLSSSSTAIKKSSAISKGYTACSVCNP